MIVEIDLARIGPATDSSRLPAVPLDSAARGCRRGENGADGGCRQANRNWTASLLYTGLTVCVVDRHGLQFRVRKKSERVYRPFSRGQLQLQRNKRRKLLKPSVVTGTAVGSASAQFRRVGPEFFSDSVEERLSLARF